MSKLTRSQLKRTAILDAATGEFQEKGFQAASMDAIAERASVSKRTVYNHFDSKEALFLEITRLFCQEVENAGDLVYSVGESLEQQLMQYADNIMTLYASERFIQLSRTMIAEYMHSDDLAKKTMGEFSQYESSLVSWIQSAIDDNRLKPGDPDFMATQFTYLLKGFGFWSQVVGCAEAPSRQEREQIIQSAVALFLGYYLNLNE